MKQSIRQTIIVEGRDDTAAVKRAVDAMTIETHGYGITQDTWELIAKASDATGIIVFTDPDHAGDQIRKRIMERFPDALEAFLDRQDASKDGDIGIENASPESIRQALAKAHAAEKAGTETFTVEDMFAFRLTGADDSSARRKYIGKALGIGYANCKTFMTRLNRFGVTREQVNELTRTFNDK